MGREQRFRPVGAATPAVEATAGAVAAAILATGSAIRRARVFHPDGVGFEATLDVGGGSHGAPFLDTPARHHATVRLSRAIGLPERLPDVLGMAVRIRDAHGPGLHQDLLAVTSWSAPAARHLLVPSMGFDHERWSTLLPYRVGDRKVVIGARRLDRRRGRRPRFQELRDTAGAGDVRFALELASISGPWTPFGVLRLGDALDDDETEALRFDPSNTGGGLEPVGVLQAIRRLSYRASQAARPT